MDKFFEDIFLKKADNTQNGYYSYNVKYNNQDNSNITWDYGNQQDIFKASPSLGKIINKIAKESKPFLEISCGERMGLAPLILKCNPEIKCLVTDIDDTIINGWREFIDNSSNDLKKYNISLARFNNCDIPIKDESFYYITCTLALNYLYDNKNSELFIKALEEVYRVLRKGGRLVAVEHMPNFEFDMTRIYQECQPNGTLHNLYPLEILIQIQKDLHDEAICQKQIQHNLYISTGFKIEVDEEVDVDGNFIECNASSNAFGEIHERAKVLYDIYANCNTRIEENKIFNRIMKLKHSSFYWGVKRIMKKQLLVLHKS